MNRLGLLAVVLVLGFCGTAEASWHRVHLGGHGQWAIGNGAATSVDTRVYCHGRRLAESGQTPVGTTFSSRDVLAVLYLTPRRTTLRYRGAPFTLIYRFR